MTFIKLKKKKTVLKSKLEMTTKNLLRYNMKLKGRIDYKSRSQSVRTNLLSRKKQYHKMRTLKILITTMQNKILTKTRILNMQSLPKLNPRCCIQIYIMMLRQRNKIANRPTKSNRQSIRTDKSWNN